MAASGFNCGRSDHSLQHIHSLGLACRLSYSTCGILVPQPGIEPTSSALQNGFLATGMPGKPQKGALKCRPIWDMCHRGPLWSCCRLSWWGAGKAWGRGKNCSSEISQLWVQSGLGCWLTLTQVTTPVIVAEIYFAARHQVHRSHIESDWTGAWHIVSTKKGGFKNDQFGLLELP